MAKRRRHARGPATKASALDEAASAPSERPAGTLEEGTMSPARRLAWWALVATVFVVPVATSHWASLALDLSYTFDPFDLIKVSFLRGLTLVALAAWGWDLLRRGGKVRHTPVDWLVLAFLAWATLATLTSIHPPTSVFGKMQRYEGLLTLLDYGVIYFLVLQFADRADRVRTLARSLFWSSVVVAGYGVLQAAGLDPVEHGSLPFEANQAFSTYGNPNALGAFLIFAVPVSLGLAMVETKMGWRLVYWAGFGLNASCPRCNVHSRRLDRAPR